MSKFSAFCLLNEIASAMFSALHEDLPDIEYSAYTPTMKREGKLPSEAPKKKRRPDQHDLDDVVVFTQMWGSTALGFGGIGGAAMTTAPTIVFRLGDHYAVYFGGRHAYTLSNPGPKFFSDMAASSMVPVGGHKTRYASEAKTET